MVSRISLFVAQNQGRKKYSGRLLISALATVGALLLVALMCFWGCFLYKKFGKNDGKSLAMDVSGGTFSLLKCVLLRVHRIQHFYLLSCICQVHQL